MQNHTISVCISMSISHRLLDIVIDPIKDYLHDTSVQEIMVNHTGNIVIEQSNRLCKTSNHLSPSQIETLIRVIASGNGICVSEQNPSFSSKIEGINCRFQGLLPPASTTPIFCIRKQYKHVDTLVDLHNKKMICKKGVALLKQAVFNKKNILVSGGTGSGKTTLLNAILHEVIDMGDRIIVIEDTPELQISENNNVRLLVGPHYNYTKAIFDVLRMRPDRIVVGELRNGAALDLLKAWNTGHGGGFSTIHANSANASLTRLIQLIEEVSVNLPWGFVAEAIDLCVFVSRMNDIRKVTSICEVIDYNFENKKFITKELI